MRQILIPAALGAAPLLAEAGPTIRKIVHLSVVNLRLEDILGYGFTAWRALLPQLAKQKIAASPHAWGVGLKTIYTGHLAAALGNIPTIEGVTCGKDDVKLGDNRIVDGSFHQSTAPGFGLVLG